MVRKGDILYNPSGRQTITFIQTSEDTAGLLLQTDVNIAPGGRLLNNKMHIHPKQEEVIFLKSGVLLATINGIKKIYGAGDVIYIPAGVAHQLEIPVLQEELNFICEMRPALCTEILYETFLALPQNGLQNKDNSVPLLQAAVTLNKYRNLFYLAKYPVWLQKIFFFLLAPMALLAGYKADLSYQKASKQLMFSWQSSK